MLKIKKLNKLNFESNIRNLITKFNYFIKKYFLELEIKLLFNC